VKRTSPPLFCAPLFIAFACLWLVGPAFSQTQTLFGTLSNFDVFNDTGQETHGFEIELDGITSKDVSVTFGSPYQARYGTPVLVDFAGGVYVRYQSPYDAARQVFTGTTPIPPAITPTAGHSCWIDGAPGYLTSGCEHFGIVLLTTPATTQYRWLIADPATPGALMPFGASVSIPAPVWTVVPAPAGGAPMVQAALPPPKAPPAQFGEAIWVKTYETESPDKVALNHLVTDDPAVPQNAGQLETEWELSQSNPKKPDKAVLVHGKTLGKGNQSVIRRFELYKFTGTYDPQTHQALCSGGECTTPLPSEVGAYIGAQMGAAQVGPAAASAISGVSNSASGQAGIAGGSWVSIYGTSLSATTRSWQNSDFVGNGLPLALDGVSVKINGKAAAVYYISPGQLNVQAPTDNSSGAVAVQVTGPLGTAAGTATLQTYAPGFFTQGKYVAAVHTDGVYVAPSGFFGGGLASRPAQSGEILLLFGTGFGPTAPAVLSGQIFNGAAPLTDPAQLHIRIGGVPATVQFAGLVVAGEYQFNVVIPPLPNGDQPVVADIGGVTTQSGLSITVKN
jgi:uncharacterized protein (TIGR03437 family)